MQISNNNIAARYPVCGPVGEPSDKIGALTSLEHIEHRAGLDVGH